MSRLLIIVFIFSLLASLASLQKGSISTVKASPDIYQGNLVLAGNDMTIIEGRFDINGSIIVEDNATLMLRNALLNFTQTGDLQFGMVFRNPGNGNPRFIVENSELAISDDGIIWVEFLGNSSTSINMLKVLGRPCLWFGDHSSANLSKSSLYSIAVYDSSTLSMLDCTFDTLYPWKNTSVDVRNSTIIHNVGIKINSTSCSIDDLRPGLFSHWNFKINCSAEISPDGWTPNLTLTDTKIGGWSFDVFGTSNMTIRDSELSTLWTADSSTVSFLNSSISEDLWCYDFSYSRLYDTVTQGLHSYQNSRCLLVNSTSNTYEVQNRSKMYVYWYLDCHVTDSIDQDVSSANVSAYYQNATFAESDLTGADGRTRIILIEKVKNATGDYPIGIYTITAAYNIHSDQTIVDMTGNRQTILKLKDLVIQEFQSFLVLSLFMTAMLITIILYRRKQPH